MVVATYPAFLIPFNLTKANPIPINYVNALDTN